MTDVVKATRPEIIIAKVHRECACGCWNIDNGSIRSFATVVVDGHSRRAFAISVWLVRCDGVCICVSRSGGFLLSSLSDCYWFDFGVKSFRSYWCFRRSPFLWGSFVRAFGSFAQF
ncbi:F15O4.32 [Arabidopsis thaliana]|uniref:F15O4.32 n=1 Tax=Arabidopsis thaliana TaxID=3702 RepID=Q9LQF3_ARATH|nr:F15O4.32 [Arabidopsis thaliana]